MCHNLSTLISESWCCSFPYNKSIQWQASSKSNQIKSLLLSHHHSTSALVSEILTSVLQTVQKKTIYIWTVHIYRLYLQTVNSYALWIPTHYGFLRIMDSYADWIPTHYSSSLLEIDGIYAKKIWNRVHKSYNLLLWCLVYIEPDSVHLDTLWSSLNILPNISFCVPRKKWVNYDRMAEFSLVSYTDCYAF